MEYPPYPGNPPQYPGGPVAGEEDVLPPLPPGTPYFPPGSPSGPVAGEQDQQPPSDAPQVNPWPAPLPSGPVAGAELPPMPWVPWTPTNPVVPAANCSCPLPWLPYQPPATGPSVPVAPGPVFPGEIGSIEPIPGGPPVQGSPEFPELPETPAGAAGPMALETPVASPETVIEPVEVEPEEAVPGEPETTSIGEEAEQLPSETVLGTLEGTISVKVGDRRERPLANQLVLIYNRATGERFQAYTDNRGFYSRRVPEGRYIVQIRQRMCAPFVRQRLARIQGARRTQAGINVTCTTAFPDNAKQHKV